MVKKDPRDTRVRVDQSMGSMMPKRRSTENKIKRGKERKVMTKESRQSIRKDTRKQ